MINPIQSQTSQENCERCNLYKKWSPGTLHHYEFSPNAEVFELPAGSIFFNVAEVRLYAPQEVSYEGLPYSEEFLNVLGWHEYVPGHIAHIPPEKIRPSLCGSIEFKRKGGLWQIVTLILDGHHSAQRRIQQGLPVALQVVPYQVMAKLQRSSLEELMSQKVMVLEW